MTTPRLTERRPELTPDSMVEAMKPPPRFDAARFDNYVPNPDEPSQAEAVASCREFAAGVAKAPAGRAR